MGRESDEKSNRGLPETLTTSVTLVLAWLQACCVTPDILPSLGLRMPICREGPDR